jgi:hypothetical protein
LPRGDRRLADDQGVHGQPDQEIHAADSLAPAVTPLVRIPANGAENAQWLAKQALDLGFFGIVWPRIATVRSAAELAEALADYVREPGPYVIDVRITRRVLSVPYRRLLYVEDV